jgi:hypothetical protein
MRLKLLRSVAKLTRALASLPLLLSAGPAGAHGFGQRYDLPIPLRFYIWGAGATVALSFVGLVLFLRQDGGAGRKHPELQLDRRLVGPLMLTARAISVGVLVLVIVAGLIGNQDPIRNIAPVAIWILAWVGMTFLSVLLGDVWALINPWSAAFALAETVYRRASRRSALGLGTRYPERVGVWPAFVLFILFAWMELIWSDKAIPASLAAALLAYSGLTWLGMLVFGREAWLRHGEVFALVFGTFARFGPFARAPESRSAICIRLPAVGLLEDRPLAISTVMLVIALLATVTFDGILETPLWARLDLSVFNAASDPDSLLSRVLQLREDQAVRLVRTFGLLGCVLVFVAGYSVVCWTSAAAAGGRSVGAAIVARRFVLTLVPISLAYHVAHYFSLLFVGGQYAIPLISDPLGWGWDLFGTAGYQVDIAVVTPRLQWAVAVVAVVLGHVIALYLSHVTALRVFGERHAALASQLPMVLLMIGYTMLSLWILSQPIVETGAG